MPQDKAAYLTAHYLTVDKQKSSSSSGGTFKKRKRKQKSSNNDGLLITEDDDLGWGGNDDAKGSDEEPVTVVAGTSAEFRRTKKSNWKTVGAPIPTDTKDARDAAAAEAEAAAEADAVLAQAAAERAAAARETDGDDPDPDTPMLDAQQEPPPGVAMMADGTHAGLQSAKALTAQIRKREKAEREELARMKAAMAKGEQDEQPELILRDATGRRVDVSMRRAEARRAALDAEKAEEAKKRALKGEVQLEEARRRKEALQDAALMPLARHKDDEEMNRELKAQARWNDPMAQFLENNDASGVRGKGGSSSSKNRRRPVYTGPAPPNRYGIRPGYRWDGVDRGNGFEAERFKALNRRERNKGLEYSWQMDV